MLQNGRSVVGLSEIIRILTCFSVYLILNLIVIIIIGVLGGEKRSLYYAAIALSIIAFLCLIGATITKYLS